MGPLVRTMTEMDCARLRQVLLDHDHERLAWPEVRRHLAECPACQALASDDGKLVRALSLAEPALGEAPLSFAPLAAELERERRWSGRLKSLPGAVRWLAAAAALALPAALALVRPRTDLGAYPVFRFAGEMVVLFGLAAMTCWPWLRALYRPRPRAGVGLAGLAVALGLPWLLASLPPATGVTSHFLGIAGGAVARQTLGCLALGTALAVPVWAVLGGLGRYAGGHSLFALFPATAAALAALAGLAVHCPLTDRGHLLGGHAPIAVLLPVAALLVRAWRSGRIGSRKPRSC